MIISFFQYFNSLFLVFCKKKRPPPRFSDQKGKRNEQKQEEQEDKEVRYSRRILSMKRRASILTPAKKESKHVHLQFASRRRRLHQHRVLVSLRGHFQALQRRTLQRDRRRFRRRRRFGAGGFYATHARSSCGGNSGVSYNRSAQRQRRHPLWV